MDILDRYFALQREIFAYFGYTEDWRVLPLADQTDQHWLLIEQPGGSGEVVWSPGPLSSESIEAGSTIYDAIIYTQRHLPKWVYRAADFTMVCVDTQCDGNKLLMVFDNAKECKDETLMQLYLDVG